MSLTLYKLDASPPARAAMMTVEILGLKAEFKDVNLLVGEHLNPDYLKLNPQHTVPTLVDGDFSIWDSHAIAAYLVSKYAADDSLYPRDLQKRALVDQRLHFDSGVLFPALRSIVGPILWQGATSIPEEQIENVRKAYQHVENFLEGRSWLAGEQLTIADVCAVASVSSLNAIVPLDTDKYPKVSSWLETLSKQDFFAKRNLPGLTALGGLIKSKLA